MDVTKVSQEQIEKYRELFATVHDDENWKMPTKPFTTISRKEAEEMRDAIVWFCGGAEIRSEHVLVPLHKDALVKTLAQAYVVTSHGYYHYVGA